MLEKLADYDDALMEQLIGDIEPPRIWFLTIWRANCAKATSCRC